jgi:hypothetical protein
VPAPVLRKTCIVNSRRGFFKIYVSQAQGVFWGIVVLDDANGFRRGAEEATLQLKEKHFTGDSAEAALRQCSEWIRREIDPQAKISEL